VPIGVAAVKLAIKSKERTNRVRFKTFTGRGARVNDGEVIDAVRGMR
jgi:hypothetical protein